MSESQIIDAEMSRRMLDTTWEPKLASMGVRGLWMEITRMRGIKLWFDQRIQEKHQRSEAMIASLLAFQTNEYFNPRLAKSYSAAVRASSTKKTTE